MSRCLRTYSLALFLLTPTAYAKPQNSPGINFFGVGDFLCKISLEINKKVHTVSQHIATVFLLDNNRFSQNVLATLTNPSLPNNNKPDVLKTFAHTQHGPFDKIILNSAINWDLDPFLFKGLLANESNLEPIRFGKYRTGAHNGSSIVISGGAIGIAQFSGAGIRGVNLLRQQRQRRGEHVLGFDAARATIPKEAIPAAAELLSYLISLYGRDGGVTAYNSGASCGLAVRNWGFWRARHKGKLSNAGVFVVQGERFLPNVLGKANVYRVHAGLEPLPEPDFDRPTSRRYAGLKIHRTSLASNSHIQTMQSANLSTTVASLP